MLKETEIRQMLQDKKNSLEFHFRTSKLWDEKPNDIFVELLQSEILILETVLEESAWQKLMGQTKKENRFSQIITGVIDIIKSDVFSMGYIFAILIMFIILISGAM